LRTVRRLRRRNSSPADEEVKHLGPDRDHRIAALAEIYEIIQSGGAPHLPILTATAAKVVGRSSRLALR
jgi:hypothetical protein